MYVFGNGSGRVDYKPVKKWRALWRVEKSLTPILFSFCNYTAAMGNTVKFEGGGGDVWSKPPCGPPRPSVQKDVAYYQD